MKESFRYIKTLFHVAKTAFSNVEMEDYKQSANQYWEMLNSLDYESMLIESFTPNKKESKERLMSFESKEEGNASVKKLKREAREMQEELEDYYWDCMKAAKSIPQEEADKICYTANSVVFKLWPQRLKELSDVYDLDVRTDCILKKERTNGKQKGDKSHRRPESEFDKSKLYDNTCFPGGVRIGYNIRNIIKIKEVKACVFESVLKNESDDNKYDNTLYFTRALEQGKPEAISSGVRLEVLQFIFLKFAEYFVENKEEYLKRVEEDFYKLKPTFDFSDHNKLSTEIRNKIWNEEEKAFR